MIWFLVCIFVKLGKVMVVKIFIIIVIILILISVYFWLDVDGWGLKISFKRNVGLGSFIIIIYFNDLFISKSGSRKNFGVKCCKGSYIIVGDIGVFDMIVKS